MSNNNDVYANFLYEFNNFNYFNYSNIIFLCIGTTRLIGDSYGPIIGEILKNNIKHPKVTVIGNIKENVNANNIEYKINYIRNKFKNPYIISIDSALSNKFLLGKVYLVNNTLNVGKALDKGLIKVGNLSIKGIVGINQKDAIKNFEVLKKVKREMIYDLSKTTSNFILKSIKSLNL